MIAVYNCGRARSEFPVAWRLGSYSGFQVVVLPSVTPCCKSVNSGKKVMNLFLTYGLGVIPDTKPFDLR